MVGIRLDDNGIFVELGGYHRSIRISKYCAARLGEYGPSFGGRKLYWNWGNSTFPYPVRYLMRALKQKFTRAIASFFPGLSAPRASSAPTPATGDQKPGSKARSAPESEQEMGARIMDGRCLVCGRRLNEDLTCDKCRV